MFERFRSKIIKLESRNGDLIIRSLGGGKKVISRNDIHLLNYDIFNSNYNAKILERNNNLMSNDICETNTEFKHNYFVLSVQGFCATGSSVVVDLLREFDNTTCLATPDQCTCNAESILDEFDIKNKHYSNLEFCLYKDLQLYDFLDIVNIRDEIVIDGYIKSLISKSKIYLELLQSIGILKCDIILEFNKMLLKFVDINNADICDLSKFLPLTSIEKYVMCIDDNKNMKNNGCLFYSLKKNISADIVVSEISNFFSVLYNSIESKEYLVLDQFLATKRGYDLNFHHNFVGKVKQIVVYRDPRDQFFDNLRNSYNYYLYDAVIKPYLYDRDSIISLYKLYEQPHPDRLFISFESLVCDYENSVNRICDFLNIDKIHHVNKFKHFNPSVSIKNIGIYKNYHNQKIMQQIYNNFSEYCYVKEL